MNSQKTLNPQRVDKPELVLLFAPAAVAFWFIYVTVGEQLLGWTA